MRGLEHLENPDVPWLLGGLPEFSDGGLREYLDGLVARKPGLLLPVSTAIELVLRFGPKKTESLLRPYLDTASVKLRGLEPSDWTWENPPELTRDWDWLGYDPEIDQMPCGERCRLGAHLVHVLACRDGALVVTPDPELAEQINRCACGKCLGALPSQHLTRMTVSTVSKRRGR